MSDKIIIKIYKCTKCHHEWEYSGFLDKPEHCNWCGADGIVIATRKMDMSFLNPKEIKRALDKTK